MLRIMLRMNLKLLLVFVTLGEAAPHTEKYSNELVKKLANRAMKVWLLRHMDMDSTTVAKPGHVLAAAPRSELALASSKLQAAGYKDPTLSSPLLLPGSPLERHAVRSSFNVQQKLFNRKWPLRHLQMPGTLSTRWRLPLVWASGDSPVTPDDSTKDQKADGPDWDLNNIRGVSEMKKESEDGVIEVTKEELEERRKKKGGDWEGWNKLEDVEAQKVEEGDKVLEKWKLSFNAIISSEVAKRSIATIALEGNRKVGRGAIFCNCSDPVKNELEPGQSMGDVGVRYVPIQEWAQDGVSADSILMGLISQMQTYDPDRQIVMVVVAAGITGGSIVDFPVQEYNRENMDDEQRKELGYQSEEEVDQKIAEIIARDKAMAEQSPEWARLNELSAMDEMEKKAKEVQLMQEDVKKELEELKEDMKDLFKGFPKWPR